MHSLAWKMDHHTWQLATVSDEPDPFTLRQLMFQVCQLKCIFLPASVVRQCTLVNVCKLYRACCGVHRWLAVGFPFANFKTTYTHTHTRCENLIKLGLGCTELMWGSNHNTARIYNFIAPVIVKHTIPDSMTRKIFDCILEMKFDLFRLLAMVKVTDPLASAL